MFATACRTDDPGPQPQTQTQTRTQTPTPTQSQTSTIVEAPTPTPTPTPPASRVPGIPTAIDEIPPAWRACKIAEDCVTVEGSCCNAWPANVASRNKVRKALEAADHQRNDCKDRVCAAVVRRAVCEHEACMVWQ